MHFVSATAEFGTLEKPVPAPYLRRRFSLQGHPETASLTVVSTGFYEVYINGQRITRGLLSPYISNPDQILFSDTYDLSSYLTEGDNVIAFWLGNGLVNNPGGYIWDFDKAAFRAAPAVAFRLEAGDEIIDSSQSVVTHSSPLWFDDLRFGEYYDARQEIPDWASLTYDDSEWTPAIAASRQRGKIHPNTVLPIRVTEERKPVSIRQVNDGYLYDFGVNDSGVCRLTINGYPGQEIILNHGENLLEDGSLDLANIWFKGPGLNQQDQYICRGGDAVWTPTFTYHGFRYVFVRGLKPEQATPELLTCLVLHTDLTEQGNFRCSDETLNKLQEITRRSSLSNFHHFPTDCPHREKNGWTADAALSLEHFLLNLNPEINLKQWLECIRLAMNEKGALPGIIPTGGWGFHWGNGPAWDCVLVYIPYYLWLYRGDTAVIRESAHAILRYLEYLTTRMDENGLLAIGLGDWCPVGRGAHQYKAPLVLTDSIVSMDIAEKAKILFEVEGMELHKRFAKMLSSKLRESIRTHLIDLNTMIALGDCQTSQAMALYYGVFESGERSEAFRQLIRMIERDGRKMDVGVLGARVIFHVLAQFGRADLAYEMITTKEFPSYAWWLGQGATTLWEDFRRPGEQVTSRNHHFWGDISHWMIRWIAGLQVGRKMDKVHIQFCPQFIEGLQWAEAYHVLPEGRVSIRWQRMSDDMVELHVEVPAGLKARWVLPQGYATESGLHTLAYGAGTHMNRCRKEKHST